VLAAKSLKPVPFERTVLSFESDALKEAMCANRQTADDVIGYKPLAPRTVTAFQIRTRRQDPWANTRAITGFSRNESNNCGI